MILDLARQEECAREVIASLQTGKGTVSFLESDAMDACAVEAAVERACAMAGRSAPDIVVGVVGGNPHKFPRGTIYEESASEARSTVEMTLWTAHSLLRVCSRKMIASPDRRSRCFAFITSVSDCDDTKSTRQLSQLLTVDIISSQPGWCRNSQRRSRWRSCWRRRRASTRHRRWRRRWRHSAPTPTTQPSPR